MNVAFRLLWGTSTNDMEIHGTELAELAAVPYTSYKFDCPELALGERNLTNTPHYVKTHLYRCVKDKHRETHMVPEEFLSDFRMLF